MKLVDAHIHLSDEEYSEHVDEIIVEAKDSGVVALVSNSMDLKTCIESLKLASNIPAWFMLPWGFILGTLKP